MSMESQLAIAMSRIGYQNEYTESQWQGSFCATWDKYVKPYVVDDCNSEREQYIKRRHHLYLLKFLIFDQEAWKIGISQWAPRRQKNIANQLPFADCMMMQCVTMRSKARAAEVETDILFACRHLSIGGEWLDLRLESETDGTRPVRTTGNQR